ncbi:uncharacterized protein VP01_5876g1, partial [Puccinia sorghi]
MAPGNLAGVAEDNKNLKLLDFEEIQEKQNQGMQVEDSSIMEEAQDIGLHAITYKHFPTNARKVVFAVLFVKDYAATWSQPYLDKVFNREPVVFNKFLNDFRSRFFHQNRWHHAGVALRNLRQTGTVLAYTQDFARTIGWAKTPLMSLYQHGV